MATENRNAPENNSRSQDIHDSKRDTEKLKQDKATLDLPDVKDIPGQEHVHVPRMDEMADITIASDDEEGVGIFEDEEDDTIIVMGSEDDIPKDDKAALETMDNMDVNEHDDAVLVRGVPDNNDFEGEELNEKIDMSGSDLDTSGIDEDDENENIGKEDEENNLYSPGNDSEQESDNRG